MNRFDGNRTELSVQRSELSENPTPAAASELRAPVAALFGAD